MNQMEQNAFFVSICELPQSTFLATVKRLANVTVASMRNAVANLAKGPKSQGDEARSRIAKSPLHTLMAFKGYFYF